jgi:hypothetical protein
MMLTRPNPLRCEEHVHNRIETLCEPASVIIVASRLIEPSELPPKHSEHVIGERRASDLNLMK